VNKLKPPPPGKQLDYFDAGMPGLVLRLSYGGKKTWRALHYVKTVGKDSKRRTEPRTHALGPILNLKTAREKSTSVSCRPAKGPSRAEAGTFKQIAADWIREYVDEKGLRSKGEIERHLKSYVYPQCEHFGKHMGAAEVHHRQRSNPTAAPGEFGPGTASVNSSTCFSRWPRRPIINVGTVKHEIC
jgi:hypothetical protein